MYDHEVSIPEQLTAEIDDLLGSVDVPMEVVDQRVRAALGPDVIVWEGDAQTFRYGFVNDVAERLLGYPRARWLDEPSFWSDVVVHEYDRGDAVSYCALATARKQHHVFDYRASSADGCIVCFRDYVKVLLGPRNIPQHLRGIMIDVTHLYANVTTPQLRSPGRDVLEAMTT
jgi:PAS domain-containing protein